MCGCEAKKVEIWSDSAADTVGLRVITVTVQPRAATVAARRRNGIKWPIPEQGNRATCGGAIFEYFGGSWILATFNLY